MGGLCLWLTNLLTVNVPIEVGNAIDALTAGLPDDVVRPVILIGAMGAGIIVVRTLSRVLVFNPGRDVEYGLRRELFERLMEQQPSFYAMRSTGDIVSRASNDISVVRAMVGYGLMQVVNVTIAVGLTTWKMVEISLPLTLGVLLPVLLGIGAMRLGIRKLFDMHMRAQVEIADISEHVLGSLQGIATIQGFVAEDAFSRRFLEKNERLLRTRMMGMWVGSVAFPALAVCGGVSMVILLWWGGTMAIQQDLSVGDIAAYATLIKVLVPPLRSLGWMVSVFQRGRAALERIYELIDVPVERSEGADPLPLPADRAVGFEVDGLTFSYPDAPERTVLEDVHFSVPPGAVVGLFGRTGSGKSTLLRLLARQYNPPAGTVAVRGSSSDETVDVTQVSLDAWRERLAVASQRPFLFSDSIRDNVALVARPDEERVRWATETAALSSDLELLPRGLDTLVGERGIMLSGGQRQRVALARAVYRQRPGVILLDDVLSAVDHETEDRLVRAKGIVEEANSYYILAYCSPKRSGDHEIELQLIETEKGTGETLAILEYDFNADGFEGGCDSSDFECSDTSDSDGDGYTICDGDCDDDDSSLNLDDGDGDGYSTCDGDCDDNDSSLN
ncbi:MAG: ABC transporter ATP-binding protein, partial [Myxococcota bacterium]|nr:ABC transporter ATP-binding protein [Myxococcota bacterium]